MGVWIETIPLLKEKFQTSVTPYVGVWIETTIRAHRLLVAGSHPTWVCGLKQICSLLAMEEAVTPYVGVWIETLTPTCGIVQPTVTPYVGVWIETLTSSTRTA